MDGFLEDICFYQKHLLANATILELGCGTGRISRALSSSHTVVGLDLSLEMLQQAASHQGKRVNYICMDMTEMAFQGTFDHILIPYNTLNLLQDESIITACLKQARGLLHPEGSLLFQVHIPQKDIGERGGGKVFQFQVFSLPGNGGKLIKESIRSQRPQSERIELEERYRVRPAGEGFIKEDFRHTMQLAGFSAEKWISLLNDSGFATHSLHGAYDGRSFQPEQDSLLLVRAGISQS